MKRHFWMLMLGLALVSVTGLTGIWVGRHRVAPMAPARDRLVAHGVVKASTVDVAVGASGRVRLVAVREGDLVKAGQLIAWLEAPELREAVRSAEREVRDAQDRLEAARSRRPTQAQQAHAAAVAEAEAAQRALEDAEDLAQQAPVFAQRAAVAEAAYAEASAVFAEAERLAGAYGAAAGGSAPQDQESSGKALPGAPLDSGGAWGAGSPGESPVLAAVKRARREKEAAAEELSEARRLRERAEGAGLRLRALADRAQRLAVAEGDARIEADRARGWDADNAGESMEDRLERELSEAHTAAARARVALKSTLVAAPVDGIVARTAGAHGDALATGQAVVVLSRLDDVWVELTVPGESAAHLCRKQPAIVRVETLPGMEFRGEISEIRPCIGEPGNALLVKVSINNPDRKLHPGAEVEVRFRA